jgi:hypothetical protein
LTANTPELVSNAKTVIFGISNKYLALQYDTVTLQVTQIEAVCLFITIMTFSTLLQGLIGFDL